MSGGVLWRSGFVALLITLGASVPTRAQGIISGPGWEAFPNVEYRGGDSRVPDRRSGILVLDDSSLTLYRCPSGECVKKDGKTWKQEGIVIRVPLRTVTGVATKLSHEGPSVADRISWGAFAPERDMGFVALTLETESSVEAPVFKTGDANATALAAKVRFRLGRLRPPSPS